MKETERIGWLCVFMYCICENNLLITYVLFCFVLTDAKIYTRNMSCLLVCRLSLLYIPLLFEPQNKKKIYGEAEIG